MAFITTKPKPSTPDPDDPHSWIEELHNRSWEMELLMSGFAIFGLFNIHKWLGVFSDTLMANVGVTQDVINIIGMTFMLVTIGARILASGLVILVILRGFWIGVVGLNSVYPEGIRFELLGFQARYMDRLKTRLAHPRQYAVRLDRICSIIFAFAFLIIFVFLSIGLYFIWMTLLAMSLKAVISLLPSGWHGTASNVVNITIILPYLALGLLFAIDFLTLGGLKRIRWAWFARPYAFASRFFGRITLAFLKDTLYYTIVTHVSRKLVAFVLLALIVVSFSLTNFRFDQHIFFPAEPSPHRINYLHYENLRQSSQADDNPLVRVPTIQSDVISEPFVRLFINYHVMDNETLLDRCPDIATLRSDGVFSLVRIEIPSDEKEEQMDPTEKVQTLLNCFSDFYVIELDGQPIDPDFQFYTHPNLEEDGLLAFIPVDTLAPGRHVLAVRKNQTYADDYERQINTDFIPFWLVKE